MSTSVSIYDVAREAGVSYATVSRALNDRAGVKRTTRERVLAAAQRLGYVPSPLARGLSTQSTAVLGIIVPGMADPFFMPVAKGIEEVARRLGHAVMLCDTGRSADAAVKGAAMLAQFRVAGVVVLGGSARLDQQLAERLRGIPTVVALRRARDGLFPSVHFDHAAGTRLLGEHLLGLGRRRIAFIALNDDSVASHERLRGYKETLRDAGVALDPTLLIYAGHTIEHGTAATEQLLTLAPRQRPDAIMYASDAMALAGLRRLLDAGVRVPDDIAVTGYGDIAFAALTEPPLTTVRVHKEQIGILAAQVLERMIAGAPEYRGDVEVALELVIRASTVGTRHSSRPNP